ncbi:MAG: alpha-2-macroglobulin, partial [Planctomycetota bacterium]|nr:alpha-2-macroglobulin [Planctomycetota bacterium]
KVLRSAHENRWFPRGDWDWLYGRGYWWFSHDYAWYPGWSEWGCKRPWPWWWPRNSTPPEVVAEGETAIGADGTVKLEIDTALARALHPDQDHRYEITAEVTDRSRRTIVGRGRVLAARRPFQVVVWVDRGYYHVGDTVRASFSARTLDGRPVPGKGEARLYSVRYREGSQPEESEVGRWEVETDVQGMARWQLKASEKGQYRLAARVTDGAGHTIEGGYVFTVMGDALDGSEFRFNDVELVPDKKEYRPGETVKLQVNAERMDATVLLFARPSNGVYLRPRVLRLRGKSAVIDVPVVTRDMPNFFVEALTVSGGGVHSETREIHVPPRKRILSLDVLPSAEQYLPGEKATVKLKIRDVDGGPFVGSTVVAIYDKSVEYIAGGSKVPDIWKFFWSWRRRHSSYTESNLDRRSGNLTLPRRPAMADVGMFGATAVDELATSWFSRAGKVKADGQLLAASALAKPGEILPESTDGAAAGKGGAGGAAELVQPTVRREFADTALWVGSLTTAADGTAEVELEMPENLTAWRIKVWGMGHGTRVGQGEAEVVTRKNLILRLQAPRFFVEKDEVVLSANVHNYLASAKQVRVSLELDGSALEPLGESSRTVEVAADGETRVDWRVRAAREGEAVVRMLALTDEESDAVEMRFPVHVHGMLKTDSFSGAIRPDEDLGRLTFRVPDERRINQSRLEVRYSPTLAGAMVDALPYLADYPHGCTEQTLNRFLPTVITQRLLREMGLDLAAIREKRTNLNAQEIGDDVARAAGWRRFDRNPVFDEKEVEKMAREGVKALTEMQLPDGGWGWFSGWGARSFPHTTAVVVRGLGIAARSDVALVPGVLEKGIAWLERYQKEQVQRLANAPSETKPYKVRADNLDALVFAVLVEAERPDRGMLEYLYRDRTHLAVYSLAILGVALHDLEEEEKLAMVVRNVEQYLVEDDENQTAYLNLPGGYWWYWYGSEYEAHAYTLKLLARTDPTGRTASRLAKYLVNNRKHGTYWNSTRDTALCVEALAEYLKASGEDRPDLVVEVWLDGEKQKEVKITQENLFAFDNKFVLFGDAVESGEHTLEIRRRGRGPLYFNAYLTNFTLEDPIERAGLELRVNRKYYKLVQVEEEVPVAGSRGQPARQRVETYERIPLENLATLESGDLVEVELEVESKNDPEYVILEDRKA